MADNDWRRMLAALANQEARTAFARVTLGLPLGETARDRRALDTLVAAGLVQSEARGRHVCYRADFAAMNGLIEFLTRNCCGGDTAQCAPAAPCGPEGCA